MKCETCDFPLATEEDWKTIAPGDGEHLCWGACEPEDWRARALKAEAEVERLRGVVERLQHHYAELVRISCLSVAERQREACAEYLQHWTYDEHDLSRVRATPLVTEGEP